MLAEILFTPDVFSVGDEVLRSRLRELRETLLPRQNSSVFAVCQLGSKYWQSAARSRIAAIQNQELRSDAMALLEKLISELGVVRPFNELACPKSEADWVLAAARSSGEATFDGIVATQRHPEVKKSLSVEGFLSDEFQGQYLNPRPVERTLEAQASVLRAMCLHSQWLIVRFPQIHGGVDDEIVTVKQILRHASAEFPGKRTRSVEVHVCRQKKTPDARLKALVEEAVSPFRGTIDELSVKLLPPKAFTDRQLLGGEWAPMPRNQRMRRARWLLVMTHVAIGTKRKSAAEPCVWSMFGRKIAHERLLQVAKEVSADG